MAPNPLFKLSNAIRLDVQRYLNAGFSIDDACAMVNRNRLGRHGPMLEKIKEEYKK